MEWTPDRIKALRKRLGMNQSEFADALGFARYQSVSEMENGGPVSSTVARLLEMLERHGSGAPAESSAPATPADDLRRMARELERVARQVEDAGQ